MRFDVRDINKRITRDPIAFIGNCDKMYYRKVTIAADVIIRSMEFSPVVLLAGPSGSTKTTTAQNIVKELEHRGIRAHKVSLDDYFMTLNRDTCPRTEDGEIDFESPLLLDMELLSSHFKALKHGEEILIPHFDFTTQTRKEDEMTPLSISKDEVVIFEGIHALNDDLAIHSPEALGLFVTVRSQYVCGEYGILSGAACRQMRRLVRDDNFRGTGALDTLKTWANVCLGETKHIDPYKDRADYIVDTGLAYEVCVLAPTAAKLLEEVEPEAESFPEASSVYMANRLFEHLPMEIVPKNSPLREFIGPVGFVKNL